ncbi:hypothetical protein IWX49DRAFT_585690 [Phyllosticta citricarpa]
MNQSTMSMIKSRDGRRSKIRVKRGLNGCLLRSANPAWLYPQKSRPSSLRSQFRHRRGASVPVTFSQRAQQRRPTLLSTNVCWLHPSSPVFGGQFVTRAAASQQRIEAPTLPSLPSIRSEAVSGAVDDLKTGWAWQKRTMAPERLSSRGGYASFQMHRVNNRKREYSASSHRPFRPNLFLYTPRFGARFLEASSLFGLAAHA